MDALDKAISASFATNEPLVKVYWNVELFGPVTFVEFKANAYDIFLDIIYPEKIFMRLSNEV
jgi:hypothetical protein